MIWLLSSQLWALECTIPSDMIYGGNSEKGFSSLFNLGEPAQLRPHWNDNILRMTVLVEGAEDDLACSAREEKDTLPRL